MHNYYPLVARAVSRLESNTPAARDALFEKLRVILIDQLRIRQPPASSSEIMRERAALEVAIRKVKSEAPIPSKSSLGLGSAQTPGSKPIFSFSGDPVRALEQRAEANGPPREPKTVSEGQHPNLESTTAAGHPASHQGFTAAKQQVDLEASIPPKSRLDLGSAQTPGSKPIFSSNPVRVPGHRAEANGSPLEPIKISEGQHPNLESTTTAGRLASHRRFVAAEQQVELEAPIPPQSRLELGTSAWKQAHLRQQPGAGSRAARGGKSSTGRTDNDLRRSASQSQIDHDGRPTCLSSRLCGRGTTRPGLSRPL